MLASCIFIKFTRYTRSVCSTISLLCANYCLFVSFRASIWATNKSYQVELQYLNINLQFQLFVFYFRWEVVLKTFKVLYFYQIFWPNNLYIIKYTTFCLLLRGFQLDLLEHYASYKWINALINNSKLPATIKKSSHSSAISWLRLPILFFSGSGLLRKSFSLV